MMERYELDTHFESGIGVGIRGYMKKGPVTIFKVSGDLQCCFIAEGELLCSPIGNHHIILPGHHRLLLEEIVKNL